MAAADYRQFEGAFLTEHLDVDRTRDTYECGVGDRTMTAHDQDLRGADRVREVFARVRNTDPGVADLYTEDAILLYGRDCRAVGREEIRAFYVRTFEALSPQPLVEAILEEPPRFVAIVDVPTGDRHHRALDLFELCDDGIRRLEIFSRG